MKLLTDPRIEQAIARDDEVAHARLLQLRALIADTARELGVEQLEETVKWGEPAFLSPNGSTIRINANSTQVGVYFHCQSRLVPTFRRVFDGVFSFDGDRAIVFELDEDLPEGPLKRCLGAALCYHNVKQLPDLGL